MNLYKDVLAKNATQTNNILLDFMLSRDLCFYVIATHELKTTFMARNENIFIYDSVSGQLSGRKQQ